MFKENHITINWALIGDAIIQLNEVISAKNEANGLKIIFKNGSCIHVNETTTEDLWKIICSDE